MDRKQLTLYVILPTLAVAGAATYHRIQRNRELSRQEIIKAAGQITVSTVKVQPRPFRGAVSFTGSLLAVNRAELRSEVPGRITRVSVSEGDRVARGTVLSVQDEEDLQLAVQAAEAQLAQAQAQAQQAKRDNDRAQMLLEKRSITLQAAQQAETFLNASVAAARAAESNLGLATSRLHKAQIRAPFEGQVAQRMIQPGEMMNAGQPAFVVVDNRKLEIVADLPAEAATKVKTGMEASFRLSGTNEAFKGRVAQVAPSLLPDGRTLRIRIEVPNPDGTLKSGFFVEGEIVADVVTERPALPSEILTLQGREAEVFVVEGGIARKRRIPVGNEQGGWRPVDSLAAATEVIAQGRDKVQEGSRLNITTAKGN